jgi:hypothetical protein
MHNENEKKPHIESKAADLTCQSTQCLQGNLDTQQLAQNVSNSNEMILISSTATLEMLQRIVRLKYKCNL